MANSSTGLDSLDFFSDESILTEEVIGVTIDTETGDWESTEVEDTTEYLTKFANFEYSIQTFGRLICSDVTMEINGSTLTAISNNSTSSVDKNGDAITPKFACPYCGKEVDQLLANGYCSSACAAKARIARAQSTVSAAGEKTLEIISSIQQKLSLLDMALNLVTELPELIKGKAKLPSEYRDYLTLRIDAIFLELKRYINILMIMKNNALIELLKKVKFGDLDAKLQVIFQPITSILTVVASVQEAMNVAAAAVVALLKVPASGMPPQSYGWLMTAKSAQYSLTASKLVVEIVPQVNKLLDFPNKLNIINYEAIESIVNVSLPPITEIEYFLDPTAFKVRYALSQDNAPRVKKLQQTLESLVVFGADTYPRYTRLSLSNVWFVLSILSGWAPTANAIYGDFIFHAQVPMLSGLMTYTAT